MSFEEFCACIQGNVLDYLPKQYQDYQVHIHEVNKPNMGTMHSMSIFPRGMAMGYVQYVEPLYHAYQKGISMDEILAYIAENHLKNERRGAVLGADVIEQLQDFNAVKDRIIINAVGKEKNPEMMNCVPHKDMGDIAATYRIYLGKEKDMELSCLVTNEIMKLYGITVDQLHEVALKNSMKAMPAVIWSMEEVRDVLDGEETQLASVGVKMVFISNEQQVNGAAVIFYPGIFDEMEDLVEGNYIVPSSVHEFVLIPKTVASLEEVNVKIKEINEKFVDASEVLSDLAHEYDPSTKQLVVAGTLQRNRTGADSFEKAFGKTVLNETNGRMR